MNKNKNNDPDREKIIELIYKNYQRGHTECNGEHYRHILYEEWKLFHISENSIVSIIDKEEYIKKYNPKDLDDSLLWTTKIYYIDIEDKIASVKLKISNQKFGYIDYFNMMKINDSWKIVHKISQDEEKNGTEADK